MNIEKIKERHNRILEEFAKDYQKIHVVVRIKRRLTHWILRVRYYDETKETAEPLRQFKSNVVRYANVRTIFVHDEKSSWKEVTPAWLRWLNKMLPRQELFFKTKTLPQKKVSIGKYHTCYSFSLCRHSCLITLREKRRTLGSIRIENRYQRIMGPNNNEKYHHNEKNGKSMKQIHCLALHITCVCMQSVYGPIFGQQFIFGREERTDDIYDIVLVRRQASLPLVQKRVQNNYHFQQRAMAQKVHTKQKIKLYNRTQKK